MAGYAAVHSGGKRGGKGRARADLAAQRRAEAWLTKRQQEREQERGAGVQAITARIARERLEDKR